MDVLELSVKEIRKCLRQLKVHLAHRLLGSRPTEGRTGQHEVGEVTNTRPLSPHVTSKDSSPVLPFILNVTSGDCWVLTLVPYPALLTLPVTSWSQKVSL